jgi:spermidine synthase
MVFVPAAALGACFPVAIRWFADSDVPARRAGVLYAVNTTGAAIGALSAGFVLIPLLGLRATTTLGIAASTLAMLSVGGLVLLERSSKAAPIADIQKKSQQSKASGSRRSSKRAPLVIGPNPVPGWLPVAVLGISGFAALIHEIAWTRLLALVLGPTIYAFSATVAAVIAGVAIGSALGTWIAARSKHRLTWLMTALLGGALVNAWTAVLAGETVPRVVAHYMATSSTAFDQLLRQGTILTAALIVPTAVCFGAAFPLGLATINASTRAVRQFGIVYAINTAGAVAGSLLCGFVFIPVFGLQLTLAVVTGCLIVATLTIVTTGPLSTTARAVGAAAALVAGLILAVGPPWDRALLASGAYLYAPYVPKDLDLETQLKAGTLLYDRDGAAATVSV